MEYHGEYVEFVDGVESMDEMEEDMEEQALSDPEAGI